MGRWEGGKVGRWGGGKVGRWGFGKRKRKRNRLRAGNRSGRRAGEGGQNIRRRAWQKRGDRNRGKDDPWWSRWTEEPWRLKGRRF